MAAERSRRWWPSQHQMALRSATLQAMAVQIVPIVPMAGCGMEVVMHG